MKYLFIDAINELIDFYSEVLEDEQIKDITDRIEILGSYADLSEENNEEYEMLIATYDAVLCNEVKEKILMLSDDSEKFKDFISLLALEYYNIILFDIKSLDDPSFYPKEENKILSDMAKLSKDEFVSKAISNDYLDEIISVLVDRYNQTEPLEVYDYKYIQEFKNEDITKYLYRKFHSNYDDEMYECNCATLFQKFEEAKITNIGQFIYLCLICKNLVDNHLDFTSAIIGLIWNLQKENKELANEIIRYLSEYFYISKKSLNGELTEKQKDILEDVEDSYFDEILRVPPLDELLKEFYNFDLLEYDEMCKNASEDVKTHIKKIKF